MLVRSSTTDHELVYCVLSYSLALEILLVFPLSRALPFRSVAPTGSEVKAGLFTFYVFSVFF